MHSQLTNIIIIKNNVLFIVDHQSLCYPRKELLPVPGDNASCEMGTSAGRGISSFFHV